MANLRPAGGGIGVTKASKYDVNYRMHEACETCGYFMANQGKCTKVEGNISPEAICKLWDMVENLPIYKDKAFFDREYEKSKR